MTNKSDVLIVGGGPSGLRAAGELAGLGLDVRLLERKQEIGRDVVCTGILGKDAFDRLGLDRSSICREIRTVRLVSPYDTDVLYEHSRPFAYVVDRAEFDKRLAREADKCGADIRLGSRVSDIRVDGGQVEVTASDAEGESRFSARILILASGIDFGFHRKLGLGLPREFLRGAQAEVDGPEDALTTIFVGKDVAPGAFAWAVPSRTGRVRFGVLSRRNPRPFLEKILDRQRSLPLAGLSRAEVRTRAIAQGIPTRTVGDRVLAVGEAAGQVKTTTGGGVLYGILGAGMAARTVKTCFDKNSFLAANLAPYETSWRKVLEKEIAVGYKARKIGARLNDRQIESLFRLARTDGVLPLIREKGDFDWHSGLIFALLKRVSLLKAFHSIGESLGIGNPS